MFEHFEVTITPFNRKRMVRVYLPKGYQQNDEKSYPVLYMHDGQNLFFHIYLVVKVRYNTVSYMLRFFFTKETFFGFKVF